MFNFLLPKKTRAALTEAEAYASGLRQTRVTARDLLPPRDRAAIDELLARQPDLVRARDVAGLEAWNREAAKLANRLFPASPWDGWRENVEVFVVAAVMALAIRTFFLQPFNIPTGSMEPTLFGIEPVLTGAPPPNVLVQAWDFLIHGKSYSHVVTKQGGTIQSMVPGTLTIWFEYTDLHLIDEQGREEVDRIWIRASDVQLKLHLFPGQNFKPGAVLANFTTQTGDKVLVDKFTYNFRPPHRGEVFIFKTAGIAGLDHERGPDQEGSQDFIKRCVALAGDVVQVAPPRLLINGQPASGSPAYAREYAQSDHYPGYALIDPQQSTGVTERGRQTYYVPADCYWAMGDNSVNSKDSRYWGGVPDQNLVGRGFLVFWPFTSRWGLIR